MNSESELDTEVCHLALLIAKAEFRQYSRIYPPSYQTEDLEHDLICHYLSVKDKVLGADSPINYATRCLYREKDRIHREYKLKVIYVESEILDGRFEGNNYFELLEGAGKLNLWDDNEKVINTEENRKASPVRPVSAKSEFSDLDKVEAWEIIKATLNQEEQKIVDLYMDGKTEREMAEATGKSHQAIHKQIKRIIERLTNKGA